MERPEPSLAHLLRMTIQDAHDLVHDEIALARAELRDELRRIQTAAVLLGAALASAAIAAVFLLTAAARAIALGFGWPVWAGFASVGGLALVAAAVTGLLGRNRLRGGRHMAHTADTMKENLKWMRAQTS